MAQDDISQSTSEETEKTPESSVSESKTGNQSSAQTEELKFSQSDLDRLLAKTRREERAKFDKQINDAQLSENERLKTDLAKVQLELRNRDAEETLVRAVKSAGGDDPETIVGWIRSRLSLEFAEDGKISNIRELLQEAKDRIPARFPKRSGSANGGDGKSSSVGQSMNDLIRQASGRQV